MFLLFLLLIGNVLGGEKKTSPVTSDISCKIQLPDFPLSKEGLMTPYKYINCKMADTPSFVQAVILDKTINLFYIYHPLVIDNDKEPAILPVEPLLPNNYEIGIWFGSNADTIELVNSFGKSNGNCVNGLGSSFFGQFAHCNAVRFFDTVKELNISIPPLENALDGTICPTVRDYSIVDADPNDNLQTQYLLLENGQTAQYNQENIDILGKHNVKILKNPSDNALMTESIYPLIGCNAYTAFDLSSGMRWASLALNELQSLYQQEPIALIPSLNPMTLVNGRPNIDKLNLYRLGVNQPVVSSLDDANSETFCLQMIINGMERIDSWSNFLSKGASPNPEVAANLYLFLMYRLNVSYNLLTCEKLLNKKIPILYELSPNGIVVHVKRLPFVP